MEELTIDDRIQRLPQELQDIVLDFYLPMPTKITISKSFKPPAQLQINHKSRASNLSNISNTTVTCTDMDLLNKWIASLTPSTAMNLRTLQHYDSARDTLDEAVQPASLRKALYDESAYDSIDCLEWHVWTNWWAPKAARVSINFKAVEFRINVSEADGGDVVFRARAELAARHNESWKKHYGHNPGAK